MTEDRNVEDRYVVTEHDRIRRLAEREGAEPVSVERRDGPGDVRIRTNPDEPDVERITWDEFFDRFEGGDRAVQYRPGESGAGSDTVLEVVDRSTRTTEVSDHETGTSPHEDVDPLETGTADSGGRRPSDEDRRGPDVSGDPTTAADSTENPAEAETEPLATGDTGDAEPVAYERTESEGVDPDDADHASTAPAADAERTGPVADGLVLDRIHESQAGLESSDEFLEFENTGSVPIDLSGWTVENEAGRTYRFPSGTALEPGGSVRLYSGAGDDTDDRLHWGSDESVWDSKDITVIVRSDTGERVLRERYET